MIRAGLVFAAVAGTAASIHLVDRTEKAGITASVQNGSMEKKWIMEANGGGVAIFDYDNDGLMDFLFVNGASVRTLQGLLRSESPEPRTNGIFLYRNTGSGKFTDVTKLAGLANPFWGTGVNTADFDGDGFIDVLVTNIGQDILFRNERNGTFKDVSRKAGLRSTVEWHTGSAFLDFDADGDLDLYIAGYLSLSRLGIMDAAPVCKYLELPVFCGPVSLIGEPDIFYRNDAGLFVEVTRQAGLAEEPPRFGFSVVATDFNQDRRVDLFVANDSGANYLYLNNGKGAFVESGLASGVAFNGDGKAQANMGAAVGDYDNDGDLDILTTTFSEDYFPLFQQTSPGVFEDVSASAGLIRVTAPLLGWAAGFTDMNNDGWRDLWLANGHVYPTIEKAGRTTYRQPVIVLANDRGRFKPFGNEISTRQAASWRGGAAADFDNDGKMDLLIVPAEGVPALLLNQSDSSRHWIGFDLRGRHPGTTIHVQACAQNRFGAVQSGGSYLSANDPRMHFGLGDCKSVDRVSIESATGERTILETPAIDRYHLVQ